MYNIFKIYNNNYDSASNKETLSELYLFIKNLYYANELSVSIEELNEDYRNNSKDFLESNVFKEIFEEHFDDLDKSYINDYEPKIYFINENIYYDDTIETIKFKFLKHYNNLATSDIIEKICFEEIYLFGLINKPFDPIEIYDSLTSIIKIN